MKAKTSKKRLLWLKPLASLLIAAVILSTIGLTGCSSGSALSERLDEWVAQWLAGDDSSLSSGMVFDVSTEAPEDDEDMLLSQEELIEIMKEQYSALLEEPASTKNELFAALMKYTAIEYKLPSKIKDGQAVVFQITGPDMSKLIPNLDATKTQSELFADIAALLQAGSYETRTVEANATIIALDNGYRLEPSFELMDGLYGGLLRIASDAIPAPEEVSQ